MDHGMNLHHTSTNSDDPSDEHLEVLAKVYQLLLL
jgi:hypothetical protein